MTKLNAGRAVYRRGKQCTLLARKRAIRKPAACRALVVLADAGAAGGGGGDAGGGAPLTA